MTTPHVLKWVAADAFVTDRVLGVPTLLRFAKDDFMEQMLRTLAQRPQALPDLVAADESGWQAQASSPPSLPDGQLSGRSRVARALARRSELNGFRSTEHAVQTRPSQAPPIKLFQPVHQRYYLAAAHLVCERPGLPPRVAGAGDRSGFVLRQVVQGVEHGFVKGEDGQGRWVPAADPGHDLVRRGEGSAQDIEELLPLFPLAYTPPAGPPRTLMAGLVPVARHDEYAFAPRVKGAAAATPLPLPSAAERWKALAMSQVIEPWQALINLAGQAGRSGGSDSVIQATAPWDDEAPADGSNLRATNTLLVEGAWRVLLGIREWLDAALPAVAQRLGGTQPPATPQAAALFNLLRNAAWPAPLAAEIIAALPTDIACIPGGGDRFATASLREALHLIGPQAGKVDDTEGALSHGTAANWPDFAFPLALVTQGRAVALPITAWPVYAPSGNPNAPVQTQQLDALLQLYEPRLVALLQALYAAIDEAGARLGDAAAQAPAAAELAQRLAHQDTLGPITYVLRFVHLRCDCGPVAVPVVSAPSAPFELAGFFDPDAPLRPIRIALPFDTTPGGLRKYGKNSAFVISDLLCGQMKRVRKLGFGDLVLSVLPWPFHKDLDVADEGGCNADGSRFGMICSLSIPIITIVAFVLLIVIATLLDLIFRWLPFLMVCFPVPGLKGKK